MRIRLLAILFALCVFVQPAQAKWVVFNDPELGSGSDQVIILAAASAVTLTSPWQTMNDKTNLLTKIVVSTCTGCNIQVQLQMMDPDGTVIAWDAQTAITATTTGTYVYYGCTGSTTSCSVGNMTGPPTLVVKAVPGLFRIQVIRSGGSWTGNVQAVAW